MHLPDTPQDHDNRVADRVFSDEWVPRLEALFVDWETRYGPHAIPYSLPLKDSTGLECWREMFDDGMTPNDAFYEDQSCWTE